MDRFKVIYGFKNDDETQASYWWIEMTTPITENDLVFEVDPEPIQATDRMLRLNIRAVFTPELTQKFQELGLFPYEWSGDKRVYANLEEHFNYHGCRTEEQRAKRLWSARISLLSRLETKEHVTMAVESVNNRLAEEIRSNNRRYEERIQRVLLGGVRPQWFDERSKTVADLSRSIKAIRESIGVLTKELWALEKRRKEERCDTLLSELESEGWLNNDKQPIPEAVREPVRKALRERKAYEHDEHQFWSIP